MPKIMQSDTYGFLAAVPSSSSSTDFPDFLFRSILMHNISFHFFYSVQNIMYIKRSAYQPNGQVDKVSLKQIFFHILFHK